MSNSSQRYRFAILCREVCSMTRHTLDALKNAGIDVSVVIIETQPRKKWSETERICMQAHAEFLNHHPLRRVRLRAVLREIPRWGIRALPLRVVETVRDGFRYLPFTRRNYAIAQAENHHIPAFRVAKHSCDETKRILEKYKVDYAIVVSSSWLIKEPLLSMTTQFIHAHEGVLPKHRSFDSNAWALLEGGTTGISIFVVDAGIDSGPILLVTEIPPQSREHLYAYFDRLVEETPQLYANTCLGLLNGSIVPVVQHADAGVRHKPMTAEELRTADRIIRKELGSDFKLDCEPKIVGQTPST